MILNSDNFAINMIVVDGNDIKKYDISDKVTRFTNSNSAHILGQENMKYKIMFENLEFDKAKNTLNPSIIIQVSLKINDKFFNPYLFLPIQQNDPTNSQEGPGRAMSYQLFENKFNHLWLYFTHSSINDIIDRFSPSNQITIAQEYVQEYISGLQVAKTN